MTQTIRSDLAGQARRALLCRRLARWAAACSRRLQQITPVYKIGHLSPKVGPILEASAVVMAGHCNCWGQSACQGISQPLNNCMEKLALCVTAFTLATTRIGLRRCTTML
jgi:hypothetical protein